MYCLQGEMDKAEDVINLMAIQGFAPDLAAYKMFINGYAKRNRKDEALRLPEKKCPKRN